MNAKQIKESYNIIHFLYRLGFAPEKIKGSNHWFLSPIRDGEKTASFKVDVAKNVWFDHGLGVGGNIIDLGVQLFSTSDISIVIAKVSELFSSFPQQEVVSRGKYQKVTSPKLEITGIKNLHSYALLSYIKERGISKEVALTYCKEYSYRNGGKDFVSIGFPNISGGAELRSPKFKSCIAPKDYSYFQNNGTNLVLFEGFFDFLSYQMLPEIQIKNSDFVVLNSLALVNRVFSLLQNYEKVYLFLDNDQAAKDAVNSFRLNHPKVLDMSSLYSEQKDLNEYLMKKL